MLAGPQIHSAESRRVSRLAGLRRLDQLYGPVARALAPVRSVGSKAGHSTLLA
jgi:hypothetical protein